MAKTFTSERREYWQENPDKYKYWIDRFAYPEEIARKRGYVYFGELENLYSGSDINFSSKEFENLKNEWIQIFKLVSKLQKAREQNFITNIDSYIGKLTKEQQDFLKSYKTSTNEEQIVQSLQKFFQASLVNEQVSEMLRNNITNADFAQAFDNAVSKLITGFQKAVIDEKKANELTVALDNLILEELINIVSKKSKDASIKLESIKGNLGLTYNLFSTLGLIRPDSFTGNRSQIDQLLRNVAEGKTGDDLKVKGKKGLKTFKAEDFKSSLSGIRDQMLGMLSHEVKNNPNFKVTFEGVTYKSGTTEQQKTDLSLLLPSLKVGTPDLKVNISSKATSFIPQENVDKIIDIKFAQKASLSRRYQDIRDYLNKGGITISEKSLNSLFYVINNEVIRNTKVLDIPQLLDILSYISFSWMFDSEDFQDIKKSKDLSTLSLYEINGNIVPTSIIFDLMVKNLSNMSWQQKIIQPRIYPTKKNLESNYYVDKKWKKTRKLLKESDTKSVAWQQVKDWVEKEGYMSFYINSDKLLRFLNLQNSIK